MGGCGGEWGEMEKTGGGWGGKGGEGHDRKCMNWLRGQEVQGSGRGEETGWKKGEK